METHAPGQSVTRLSGSSPEPQMSQMVADAFDAELAAEVWFERDGRTGSATVANLPVCREVGPNYTGSSR